MPCAEHRSGDRGDGVGVPAKGGGEAQRFGGFIEETRGDGERRGHGFVGLHAGAAVSSEDGGEFAVGHGAVFSDGPFHEHLHAGDDGRLGRPVAARRLGFHERQRFRKEATLPRDGEAHGGGHQRGRFDALHGVVRHHAGTPGLLGQGVSGNEGDADRGGAHGASVRGAESSGKLRVDPFHQRLQRGLGGWAEQVQRALFLHLRLPAQEVLGVRVVVDSAMVFDEAGGQHEGLFRVVGHRAGLHIRRDRLLWHGVHQPADRSAVAFDYSFGRHALGRHAERVADGEADHRAAGMLRQMLIDRHGFLRSPPR